MKYKFMTKSEIGVYKMKSYFWLQFLEFKKEKISKLLTLKQMSKKLNKTKTKYTQKKSFSKILA